MLNRFFVLILKGLLTVLPLALTIYLLYWVITSIEAALYPYLQSAFYFPGLGIITTVVVLAVVGIVVNAYIIKALLAYSNRFIEKVPLIKTLYGAIKDAVGLFQVAKNQDDRKPVSVEIAPDMHAIGFVTNQDVANKLFPKQEKLPVYLPLSYQIGGYTLYVPREKVTFLDINVETAMRITITGGNSIYNAAEIREPKKKPSEQR